RMDYSPDSKLRFTGQVFAQLGKINKGDGSGILQTGVAAGGLSSTLLPPPSFYSVSSEYISSISTNNENGVRLIRPYVEGSYQIIDGLRITSALSYEFVSSTEDTFSPAAANNQFSKVYSFAGRQTQLYSRSSLNYSKTFNESHNIFINLFNEVRNVTRQDFPIQQDRTPNDNFQGPLGYDGFFSRGGGLLDNFKNERALSFALSTSYDYKRKYILDLSYRMDGSSGNGFGNLYTKNPAVGLRWNAHNEEWIKDAAPWLSLGSIRGSWGINVMPNSTLERIYGRYDITGNYNQQQGVGIRFGQIPNPNLKPTTSMQYNFGLDIDLFNNRIDFVYDTYYKKVDNLLFDQRLNSTVAFDVLASNDAAIRSDITVNYNQQQGVGIRFGQIPNPNLKPTTSMQYNFGLDIALFNNRIDFVYDTYYKKVDNLLFDQRLNSTVAFDVLASNDAAIANYGHELALNIRPLRPGGDFSWTFSINGALNKDILLKLPAHYGGQFIKWNVDNLNGQHNIFRVGTAT